MHVCVRPMPHTHTEVSSSVPHFSQVGLLLNPLIEGIAALITGDQEFTATKVHTS